MATVVDALVVTLGLDPKNFTAGQKQAAAAIVQFQQQTTAQVKKIEESTRKATQFFASVRSSAVGLFSVILGASGLEEMTRRIVTSASAVDKLSNRFQVSVDFVSKFGNVVKSVGGSVEEAQGFVQSLANSLSQANINLPDDLFLKLQNLTALGFQFGRKGGKFDPEQTIKNLADFFARSTPEIKNLIAAQTGMSAGVFEAMRKPGFSARLGAAPGIDKKLADAAQKLVEAFNTLQARVTVVAATLIEQLFPALTKIADVLDILVNTTGADLVKKLTGFDVGGGEKPEILFDLPKKLDEIFGKSGTFDWLRGGSEDDKNYKEGVERLKKMMGAHTPSGGASLGNVPVGLAALANSLQGVPGFRVTSTTGGKHAGAAHPEGRAMDMVMDPKYYQAVANELRKEGLKVIDATLKPDSPFWTGPHLHVEFANRAAAEKFAAAHGDNSTTNSSSTNIGTINVHAPSGDAGDITKKIGETIKRNSYTTNADTGFE